MKLVNDWRHVWRYFSVWAMTITGAIQGAWLAIPEGMKQSIPDDWINAVSVGLLILGVLGRLVVQVEREDVE